MRRLLCFFWFLMTFNWSLFASVSGSKKGSKQGKETSPATFSAVYQASVDREEFLRFGESSLLEASSNHHLYGSNQNRANSNSNSDTSSSDISSYIVFHGRDKLEPYFDNSTSTNITTSAGKTMFLPCRVHNLGDRTVSWIRRPDLSVLTVGKFTYTPDQRFQVVHVDNSDDWSLQIGYPSKNDAGTYECQVSTRPPKSLFLTFNVVVSKAKIIGGPAVYLNSESTLNLTCLVDGTPDPPDYIFWYHNGQVINYDSPRGVQVLLERSAQATSKLIISKAHPSDSGNYSCNPSNAEPAHIAVHVLNNGGQSAAMQHEKRSAESLFNSAHSFRLSKSLPVLLQRLSNILLLVASQSRNQNLVHLFLCSSILCAVNVALSFNQLTLR